MTRFLIRRVLFGIVVMWAITTIVFVMFFVAPHDPARLLAGRQGTATTVAAIRHSLSLDQPVLTQYLDFIGRLVHGNLGYSYYSAAPVVQLLTTRLPVTASLALGGAILWLLIGVSGGVLAATHPRSTADRAVTGRGLLLLPAEDLEERR